MALGPVHRVPPVESLVNVNVLVGAAVHADERVPLGGKTLGHLAVAWGEGEE